ncbi:MAG: polyprenyl synthetase family protein [Nitrospinota bacterium]
MDIKKYLDTVRELVDDALGDSVPSVNTYPEKIYESMRYSLLAGGKRLRPVLVIAAAEAVGGSRERVLPFACAIEMIHTYTLIHDDLPALDNDDLRRGKPTNHVQFGEAVAILAGDALLTLAFELMSDPALAEESGPRNILQACNEVAKQVGAKGTIGGQALDIFSEGKEPDFPVLEYIHTHKTGKMILASVRAGAILSGASEEETLALSRYGEHIGLAFQIVDDILDVEGQSEVIGKRVGSDINRQKMTYPALLGIAESCKTASGLIDNSIKALEPLGTRAEILIDIAEYIIARSF